MLKRSSLLHLRDASPRTYLWCCCVSLFGVAPVAGELNPMNLVSIDPVVAAAVEAKEIPGCVVLIVHQDKVAYCKAFGNRSLQPTIHRMTRDTIFDLASITKPVATATSIMILAERGQLRLQDTVARHLPQFAQNGKQDITIMQCLTHQAGFVPDSPLSEYTDPEFIWPKLMALGTVYPPGTKFVYSDVGFQVLGRVVEEISGQSLDEFVHENILVPLKMNDSGFNPLEWEASKTPKEGSDKEGDLPFLAHDHATREARGDQSLEEVADEAAEITNVVEENANPRWLDDVMNDHRADGPQPLVVPLKKRIAPTERREDRWMVGEVHDPRAYAMGGVAGHAGLFSTAHDLSRFARMMLRGGELEGARILSPAMVRLMTSAFPSGEHKRGLGWDKRSVYSNNRGETMTTQAFGHGGFTGTAMWIDPGLDLAVIVLSNRVHPDGSGTVNRLAGRIGTIAASAVAPESNEHGSLASPSRQQPVVLNGIDVLQRDNFAQLEGLAIGLITNHTGINRDGARTTQLLKQATNLELKCLFSPEHGLGGNRDDKRIGDSVDERTGLPVYSLYGEHTAPQREQLADLDALVFDIQDIGTRFYTYLSTMGNAMEVAADVGLKFFVLDRPNPIGGEVISGPVLDQGRECFVGFHPIAVRHGMTVGELALMICAERGWQLDLEVIEIQHWQRGLTWDQLQLMWIDPSPNMRRFQQALLYPGIGLLETSNISVGRGTDTPFEIVGAPWIDGRALAHRLNSVDLPGVRCVPIHFTPDTSKYQQQRCEGVRFSIFDQQKLQPLRLGIELACALRDLFGEEWQLEKIDRLLLDQATLDGLRSGLDAEKLQGQFSSELREFQRRREHFLLY